ncbi:glycosyltransferase family 39 protein [Candidatus Daviesbacteria bacterium]|nr:glycosyltransferase family 39 protein [Candidatus Daviesbacteria bacterium]
MPKGYYLLFLVGILLLCLFFRAYRLESFYGFGHDQDLFAWIARDIVVDKHFRLLGQETSINGVFIGPLFYYLVASVFFVFNMDPRSANLVTLFVSLLTVFSLYFVIAKFFGKKAGLFAAFFYSVSLGAAFFDRWVVPTQLTLLWSIWYIFVLFSILAGNFRKTLPVMAVLVGLIWHIHIAFIPLLLVLPLALWFSKKTNSGLSLWPSLRELILCGVIVLVLTSPLLVSEGRHNFQQFRSIFGSTTEDRGNVKGVDRLFKVFDASSRSLSVAVIYKQGLLEGFWQVYATFVLALIFAFILRIKNILNKQQAIILGFWVGVVLLAQFISKRQISEYYFENLVAILFLIFGLFTSYLFSFAKYRPVIILFLASYLVINLSTFLSLPAAYDNYGDRKNIVEFIKKDAQNNGYPCVGINYIADRGTEVGFRYLLWYYGLDIVKPSNLVPVYNIAIPWTYANPTELSYRSGYFGLIVPKKREIKDSSVCSDPNYQFLPLSGFVN